MPKIISEYQKIETKNAITQSVTKLICKNKGIKNITVDDIIKSVNIGKGSFYSYYKSKEECLYDAIKKEEKKLSEEFKVIIEEDIPPREKISIYLKNTYLNEKSISKYISPADIEVILRKLPPEFSEKEKEKSQNNVQEFMKIFCLSSDKMEGLGALLDCISYITTYSDISDKGKEYALDTLILSISDYIEKNGGALI